MAEVSRKDSPVRQVSSHSHSQLTFANPKLSQKKLSWKDGRRACSIFIGIDEPLFNRLGKNMTAAVKLAQDQVDELNIIFSEQVFDSGSDGERYFRLGRVQVIFGLCDGIANCTLDSTIYLSAFKDYREHCLNYIFAYSTFVDAVGRAHVGSVCQKFYNTGFVTFLSYGLDRKFEESSSTFAHEVAHNFGARHDGDYDDCRGQGFIMSSGKTKRNFSSCSISSMKQTLENLEQKANGVGDCFKDQLANNPHPTMETSLCGNGIVEPGEQCDCGNDLEACHNQHCYPAHISELDLSKDLNARFCRFTPKSSDEDQPIPESPEINLSHSLFASVSVVIMVAVSMCATMSGFE